MPEAIWFELRGYELIVQHGVVACFGVGSRDVADGLEQPLVVELVDPFEHSIFDGFEAAPWPVSVDHFGLVEAVDRLGQRVVVAVTDAAERGFDPGFGESLGIFDRCIDA